VLEGCSHLLRVCRPDDHRRSAQVRLVERFQVSNLLEDQRLDVVIAEPDVVVVERLEVVALDRDLGHADTGRTQPACAH
jgi:hypothetical protein